MLSSPRCGARKPPPWRPAGGPGALSPAIPRASLHGPHYLPGQLWGPFEFQRLGGFRQRVLELDEEELQLEQGGIWKRRHREARGALGAPTDYKPYSERTALPPPALRGVPASARMRDACDVGFAAAPKAMRRRGTGDWFCDLSQCMKRKGSYGPCPQTLTTSSRLFAYNLDCVLGAADCLCLQGYSLEAFGRGLESYEVQREVVHASGEGMALYCLASILTPVALCPTAPWVRQEEKREQGPWHT